MSKTMETYQELKQRHQTEVNNFTDGVFWAFSDEQFTEGMKSIGLTINEHGVDNNCNVPDWILSKYICNNLSAIAIMVQDLEMQKYGLEGEPRANLKGEQHD